MAPSSERPGLFRRLLKGGGEDERVRTARFPLQAYGKLPIYKDFISVGLTEPGAREFRHWLDRGFSYRWAENDEYRDADIPPHGFLLRLPESKSCVAGALWGSSDSGGLRRFPFALFLTFAPSQPAADPQTALHYLAAIERRGEEIRDGGAAGSSLSAFYQAYRGSDFECAIKTRDQAARELKSAFSGVAIGEFAEALFGERAAARWPALRAALEATVARPNGPGALRVPLSGLVSRSREVAFWLGWLEHLDPKRRPPVTGLLYAGVRGPGRAVLFFRDLTPDDFLLLHPTHVGHAQVLDLAPPEKPAPEPPTVLVREPAPAPPQALAPQPPEPAPAAASSDTPAPPAAAVAGQPETAIVSSTPEPTAPPEPAAAPSAEAAAVESALPFPEAQSASSEPGLEIRETLSALVVPIVEPAAPAAAPADAPAPAALTAVAAPPVAEPAPVEAPAPASTLPPPEPAPPEPRPAWWERPLSSLLGG